MKKRVAFLFSTAALVIGSAAVAGAPLVAPMGPGFHGQQVTASAAGGVCGQHGDTWRCRSFSVSEYREPTGQFSETRVRLEQTREAANFYAYRLVDCPVPRQTLSVMPDKAFVSVTFDAESPECFSIGAEITFEPYTEVP